jgi:hypothetical protein
VKILVIMFFVLVLIAAGHQYLRQKEANWRDYSANAQSISSYGDVSVVKLVWCEGRTQPASLCERLMGETLKNVGIAEMKYCLASLSMKSDSVLWVKDVDHWWRVQVLEGGNACITGGYFAYHDKPQYIRRMYVDRDGVVVKEDGRVNLPKDDFSITDLGLVTTPADNGNVSWLPVGEEEWRSSDVPYERRSFGAIPDTICQFDGDSHFRLVKFNDNEICSKQIEKIECPIIGIFGFFNNPWCAYLQSYDRPHRYFVWNPNEDLKIDYIPDEDSENAISLISVSGKDYVVYVKSCDADKSAIELRLGLIPVDGGAEETREFNISLPEKGSVDEF